MPGDDDLKEHAQSSVDFYELLGINFETSESDIRRAYRRAALKYHPDKNAGKPEVIEKFHILQIAYDVLSDPTYKTIYDNNRRAQKEKAERDQAFEGRRKQMKEDLERRESGAFKRKRQEEDDEEKLQREIQRLAEDGKRRRKELQERLAREKLEEEERLDREKNGYAAPQDPTPAPKGGTEVPDIDRSIKATWPKEGHGEAIDKDRLTAMFSTFGDIQSVFLLKDKKRKLGGDSKSKKTLVAVGIIVFSSVVGAHAAIEDYKKQSGDFELLESVFWASNKEPDFVRPSTPVPVDENLSPASTSKRKIPGLDTPVTPLKGPRKVPSFAFSPAASVNTPKGSPFGAAQSPSLEELTMIRLKNAEKRRLEEQIRKEEAEAEAE